MYIVLYVYFIKSQYLKLWTLVVLLSMHFFILVCALGYICLNCSFRCRYPAFGQFCQNKCYCLQLRCDHRTGCKGIYFFKWKLCSCYQTEIFLWFYRKCNLHNDWNYARSQNEFCKDSNSTEKNKKCDFKNCFWLFVINSFSTDEEKWILRKLWSTIKTFPSVCTF